MARPVEARERVALDGLVECVLRGLDDVTTAREAVDEG